MTRNQIQTFISVANEGSFTKASENLFTTRQALLRQISSLEEELGFALFIRSVKGAELTAPGVCFYEEVIALDERLDNTISRCRRMVSNTSCLSISTPSSSQMYVMDALIDYRKRYPSRSINIIQQSEPDAVLTSLVSRQVDAALLGQDLDLSIHEGLNYITIDTLHSFCVLSPSHPLASKASITLDDLSPSKVAVFNKTMKHDLTSALEEAFPGRQIYEHEGNESAFVYNWCLDGGVYLTHSRFIRFLSGLVALPLTPDFPRRLRLYYIADKSEILSDFLDICKKMYL